MDLFRLIHKRLIILHIESKNRNGAIEHLTLEMWTRFVGHMIRKEDKFWNIENLRNELLDEQFQ